MHALPQYRSSRAGFAAALLVLWCLPPAAVWAAGPPCAASWQEDLHLSQEARAALEPGVDRGEWAVAEWGRLAAGHAVAVDWLEQDLGGQAAGLVLGAEQVAALPAHPVFEEAGDADWAAYFARRAAERRERLGQTLEGLDALVFTEAHPFEMSFIGYTEGLSDARHERFFRPGSRLSVLDFPSGESFGAVRPLIEDPRGMMRDAEVTFDGKRVLFAWKKSDRLDDYHIYEHELESGSTRQLTFGLGRADYEPAALPDGGIVFVSTRPEQSVPCWWTEISNLYRMDADGRAIRRLAIDQVHTLYPALNAQGRLTYTRWDYSDRGQNYTHGLFSMLPDGRDQRVFYGNNSWFPNSLLHARGIPGSHRVVAIASGHHTPQQGKLVIIDREQGVDEGEGVTFIAPVREVEYERVDVAMQQGDQFRYPYPLGEDEFLVSYRPDRPGARFGLYWVHADGRRELLHTAPDLCTGRMVPVRPRSGIPLIADEVEESDEPGVWAVHDVYRGLGLEGVPRGAAKTLRVVRLNYRAAGVGYTLNRGEDGTSINSAPVGIGNTSWDVKEILGDAEIHEDGSAMVRVPSMESLYLQILDEKGRVIQTKRSWDTLRPGEFKSCAGCHDKNVPNPPDYDMKDTLAWAFGVQDLEPFHGETRGFSFIREIQPILDNHCVSCHNGSAEEVMDLRGIAVDGDNLNKRAWTLSYLNLLEARLEDNKNYTADPYTGPVRWICKQSRPTELPPYYAGSHTSPLIHLLEQGHHDVALDRAEMEKLSAWIDMLVPFSGDYREGAAWSPREHAFYTYYETKRMRHQMEEARERRVHQERRRGNSTPPPQNGPDLHPSLLATYGEVIRTAALASPCGHEYQMPAHEPVLTDFLRIRLGTRPDHSPATIEVRDMRGRVAGTATLAPEEEKLEITINPPVRSDRMVVVVSHPDSQPTITSASGVGLHEIPEVDGFHPFLQEQLEEQ